MNWFHQAYDRDQCWAFVSMAMVPQIPLNTENIGVINVLVGYQGMRR